MDTARPVTFELAVPAVQRSAWLGKIVWLAVDDTQVTTGECGPSLVYVLPCKN